MHDVTMASSITSYVFAGFQPFDGQIQLHIL